MLEVQLTETEPDLEVKDDALSAKVYVWHKNTTTLRVTIFCGGISRMFDASLKHGIKEQHD